MKKNLILLNYNSKSLSMCTNHLTENLNNGAKFKNRNRTKFFYSHCNLITLYNIIIINNACIPGYGKFNILLLLACLPAAWASVFSSTSISYVLPSAECDLKLSMFDKGLLNSMSFAGVLKFL